MKRPAVPSSLAAPARDRAACRVRGRPAAPWPRDAASATAATVGTGSEERQADHRALADAVRRVERATGGEVLSAERVQSDGRDVSRVKVVDASGRVRVYMDDAAAARAPRRRVHAATTATTTNL